MSNEAKELTGPDLRAGVPAGEVPDGGTLLGHVDGEAVLVARQGKDVFAVEATCTHYGGPLAEGLIVGDTVRCPWHHACFSLRTGEVVHAPALRPIGCYAVETRGDQLVVLGKKTPPSRVTATPGLQSIVIVGGGAAGHAAAEMLRNEGYTGKLTLLSADASPPCDRPNLSKDYLAGNAPEEWIPLRPPEFFSEQKIELMLGARATALDVKARKLSLEDGRELAYDRLLIATGAEPAKLAVEGAQLPHVHYLRTLGDSRAIIAALDKVRRVVVIGASFIGLEVAASLRARKIEVDVVAPDKVPLERVLGPELGQFIRSLHEEHGVRFHLGKTPASIERHGVNLSTGEALPADLVVAGVGVRPVTELAEWAGLATDRGILVDAFLETSVPGVFAAGDNARYPDPRTGAKIRVEHWVHAERQGQTAARNMLGQKVPYDLAPFFWSAHYDLTVSYAGHAEKWDRIAVEGDISKRDATLTYSHAGKKLAVVTLGRDKASLEAEVELGSAR
jgi:NADPH-dependent 2,4-dienoyl-CoA reductase/sulfur reductase-like enzyme/nitrite reductase/ring-hydroxylating ferredoxin subunit